MTVFKRLRDDRGTHYEIPLILTGYGVTCAVVFPSLRSILLGTPLFGIIPLLLLGLGLVLYLGTSIIIPRIPFCRASSCFWHFILLPAAMVPFLWFTSETAPVTATLPGQTDGSVRFDLWLAEKKNMGPTTP
jgi:hypothetical protein